MMRRPLHTVNLTDPAVAPSGASPSVPGLDLGIAAANVARWGGDPQRWTACLAAALRVAPAVARDRRVAMDLAAVAAWRAGVIGIRADALRALREGRGAAQAFAAVLGLPPSDVGPFAKGQHTDRFYWPPWRGTRPGYLLARIGGFAGLGGPWQTPPTAARAVAPGRFLIDVGADTWEVDVDLFGHAAASSTAAGPAPAAHPGEKTTAEVRVSRSSYLLDVVRLP